MATFVPQQGGNLMDAFNSPMFQVGLGLLGASGEVQPGQDASFAGRLARGTQSGMQNHAALAQQGLQSELLQEQLTKSKNERERKARLATKIPSLLMGTPAETRMANPTDQFATPGQEIVTKEAVPGLLGLSTDQASFLAEMGKENPDAVMGMIGQQLFRQPGEMAQKVAMAESRLGRKLNQQELYEMFGIGPDGFKMLQAQIAKGQFDLALREEEREIAALELEKEEKATAVKQDTTLKNNNYNVWVQNATKLADSMDELNALGVKTGFGTKLQVAIAEGVQKFGDARPDKGWINTIANNFTGIPVKQIERMTFLTSQINRLGTKLAMDDLSQWGLSPVSDTETGMALESQPSLSNTYSGNVGILRDKVDAFHSQTKGDGFITSANQQSAQKLIARLNALGESFGGGPARGTVLPTTQTPQQPGPLMSNQNQVGGIPSLGIPSPNVIDLTDQF